MGVNTRLSMKFVLASLCISIALFQVAHATTTTCRLPQGTKQTTPVHCQTNPSNISGSAFCTVAQVTSMVCQTGATGTPSITGLACATDKGIFTGATFCTLVQAGIHVKMTGLAAAKWTDTNKDLFKVWYATKLGAVCGVLGDTQCVNNDIEADVKTRRADTTLKLAITTSAAKAGTVLAAMNTITDAASLTAIKALATTAAPTVFPFSLVTLITVTSSSVFVNGVASSASSMFHFSFLATAMSVAAMVYSKL